MKIHDLREYMETGREIEFSYLGEMYSVTHTYKEGVQKIHLCHFGDSSATYSSVDDLLESEMFDGVYLQDILDHIEDIVIY